MQTDAGPFGKKPSASSAGSVIVTSRPMNLGRSLRGTACAPAYAAKNTKSVGIDSFTDAPIIFPRRDRRGWWGVVTIQPRL